MKKENEGIKVVQKQLNLITKYKELFNSKDGQKVLEDLMKQSFMLRPTHDSDKSKADRNEGKRELCLYILHMINYRESNLIRIIDKLYDEEKEGDHT
jgi:hypothetical protein